MKVFDGFTHTTQDKRKDWGEERFVAVGILNGLEIAVIYTPRNGKRRIISVRRARVEERKIYYEELRKENGDRLGKT